MDLKRRARILAAGKSPSVESMKRTYNKATLNGGVTQDFSANVENIRDISRDLGYNCLQDATFVYVPSSYGEGKNFVQQPSLRNLVKYSEEFDNPFWVKGTSVSITQNSTTAPNGTVTADLLTEIGVGNDFIYQAPIIASGSVVTFSIYIKNNNSLESMVLFRTSVSSGQLIFSWSGGIINTFVPSIGTSASYEELPDGWYKINITATTSEVNQRIRIYPDHLNSGKSIYIWGAQLEVGSIATPYQRTTDGVVDFNFTRATTATVTNKEGVIEDSCYNLLQRSEEFDDAYWAKSLSTISTNIVTAPNNTLTADKLIEDNTLGTHQVQNSGTRPVKFNVNDYFYFSVYVKTAERTRCQLRMTDGISGDTQWNFDLLNNTAVIVSNDFLNPAYSITEANNGFKLITISGQFTSTTLNWNTQIRLANNTNSTSYLGDGVSGLYIWGAQLTKGSTLRPYLRTTNRLNVPCLDYSRGTGEPELLIQPQRTNLLLNSATATTQNVTVTAVPYTLSAYGTGTYTLSGAYSGVFTGTGSTTERTVMTFTPSAGTLTLTASGSLIMVQLE